MNDDETVECEYCGDSFHKQGIGAHKAHCEGRTDDDSGAQQFEGLEADAYARDGEACVRCEATDALTIHRIDRSVGAELSNLVTLCDDCEADIAELHSLTKRTQIFHHE